MSAGRPHPFLLFALLFAALIWPAAVSGGALWFDDIGPYLEGGHLAVKTVLDLLSTPNADMAAALPPSGAPGTATAAAEAQPLAARAGEVSGARAVAYSVFAYLFALPLPRLLAVSIVQAGVTAWLVMLLLRREGLGHTAPAIGAALLLALGTTASFMAAQASPDAFAAPIVLVILLLFLHARSFTLLQRIALLLIGGFAVAAHASHILLAVALAGLAILIALSGRKPGGREGLFWPAAVGALGLSASVATAIIGFGEVSAAPKRYPIVLARAVADGPALWHLEEHCETYDYTVCDVFGGDIPSNVGTFLWSERGLAKTATPEELDAIRQEEPVILRRAFLDYPFFQVKRSARNFTEQILRFNVAQAPAGQVVAYGGAGEVSRLGTGVPPALTRGAAVLHGAFFWGSGLLLAAGFASGAVKADRHSLTILLLIIGALVANAAICGILSAPADRYQARLAWLLPLAAWILLKDRQE